MSTLADLAAVVAAIGPKIDALIAKEPALSPTDQAALDGAVTALTAEGTKIDAALAPPAA